ncbi:putative acetyl-CoA acyltransferase [Gordonia polyisoprenivorans VH2]|uniref:Lipid-transfer protein n=2 Tax=Gordonia polyisoprenivorans TaxID=84595 RepID=A0A846WN23_9ACTN|nr:thiolase domain-containing protein [Gordonia polyisoprenivorans]AFA75281.1 putative acetyl-CoA acyltransferase [Gordonia polyisoprenivorans VH2]MBE7191746.1 thiolase domain-containing protein [Gordonia polyisoprenivorans]NKY01671.1 lipid-transfer protein [Gordonia polyisoprenivorans]OZC32217.1 lipid-transfer protein [Gordonia polyisoprenivorans]UZF55596.1 thiolase domain-containing protein [Gordonia polyisoprenivorans]
MTLPRIAIVGFAHSPNVVGTHGTTNGVEMLIPCFSKLYADLGISRTDIGFWCSGSSDYLAGRAFSFISAIDSIGAMPPINESHVEMDAAWALYEAWVKIATGEVDLALAYGFGKSTAGDMDLTLALQTDPYTVAPLWPQARSLAALQARAGLDAGTWTEADMAAVAARTTGASMDDLLGADYVANPLRAHDIAPYTDAAAAVIIASERRARELVANPAFITGWDHRIDTPNFGARDLTVSPSTTLAGDTAFGDRSRAVDVAEIAAPYTHQELIVRNALRLPESVRINPSGGVLAGNSLFSAGLQRIGYAANEILGGNAQTALAHATSGPLLQQNMVVTLGADTAGDEN